MPPKRPTKGFSINVIPNPSMTQRGKCPPFSRVRSELPFPQRLQKSFSFLGEVLCWWSKHAIQADGTNLRQSRSRDHHDGLLWDHIPITITNPQQPNPSFKMFSNDIYIINVHILVIFWGVKNWIIDLIFGFCSPKNEFFFVKLG